MKRQQQRFRFLLPTSTPTSLLLQPLHLFLPPLRSSSSTPYTTQACRSSFRCRSPLVFGCVFFVGNVPYEKGLFALRHTLLLLLVEPVLFLITFDKCLTFVAPPSVLLLLAKLYTNTHAQFVQKIFFLQKKSIFRMRMN